MTGPPDVVVVGAGPAGSSLAWRLARRGLGVRLLDAREFPRSKPCGDAISPGASPLLDEMGVTEGIRGAGAVGLRGWRIRTPSGRWFTGRFDPALGGSPPVGLALERERLDAILLEAAVEAGAEIRPRRRAFGLLSRAGRAVGVRARGPDGREERHAARFVVGADGLRSRVARLLGGVARGRRRRLAVVGRFVGVSTSGISTGELRVTRDGVLGYAPTAADRCNVTLVLPAARATALSTDPAGFFLGAARAEGIGERIRDGRLARPLEVTGPFEVSPRRRTAPGALLVGDAAGYFDPFTGQGIYRALAGARLAAEAVGEALEAPEREAAARRRYERELERLLRGTRRVQRAIDAAITRPHLFEPVARCLAWRPGVASFIVDLTGDRMAPKALASPARWARALAPSSGPRGSGPRSAPRPAST